MGIATGIPHSYTVIMTRPATTPTYTIGQVIGDVNGSAIFTFYNMGKPGGDVVITSAELEVDAGSSAVGAVNVRLFNSPPTAIADAGAWTFPATDRGKYIGKFVQPAPIDEGDTLFCDNDGINKQIKLVTADLYVLLQPQAGFLAVASVVKRFTIHTIEM